MRERPRTCGHSKVLQDRVVRKVTAVMPREWGWLCVIEECTWTRCEASQETRDCRRFMFQMFLIELPEMEASSSWGD
jgi:hypothetical protein